MIDVKMHLAILYGNIRSHTLTQMSHPQLERKIQCIQEVLSALSCVEQGYSSLRGKMLNELTRTVLWKTQKTAMKDTHKMKKILEQQQKIHTYIQFNQKLFQPE